LRGGFIVSLNAVEKQMLDTATKDYQMAIHGDFGNASAEVAAKKLAEIKTLTGGGYEYTGTGSSYDKAINEKVSQRSSSGSKSTSSPVQQVTQPLVSGSIWDYTYDDMVDRVTGGTGMSAGMIIAIIFGFLFLLKR
jgi:hypothetical protein